MRWWKKKLNYFSTSSKTVMDPSHRWPKNFIIRRTFFLRISNEIRLPKKIETHESLSLWEQNSGWNMHDIICNINSETKNMFQAYSKSGDSNRGPSCLPPHEPFGADVRVMARGGRGQGRTRLLSHVRWAGWLTGAALVGVAGGIVVGLPRDQNKANFNKLRQIAKFGMIVYYKIVINNLI